MNTTVTTKVSAQLTQPEAILVEDKSFRSAIKQLRTKSRAPLRELPSQWNMSSQVPPRNRAVNTAPSSTVKPRAPTRAGTTTSRNTISTHALQQRINLASSSRRARLSGPYASYRATIATSGLDFEFGYEEGSWPTRPTPPAHITEETFNAWMESMLPHFKAAREAEAEITESREKFPDTEVSEFVMGTLRGKSVKSSAYARLILADSQKRFQSIRA